MVRMFSRENVSILFPPSTIFRDIAGEDKLLKSSPEAGKQIKLLSKYHVLMFLYRNENHKGGNKMYWFCW